MEKSDSSCYDKRDEQSTPQRAQRTVWSLPRLRIDNAVIGHGLFTVPTGALLGVQRPTQFHRALEQGLSLGADRLEIFPSFSARRSARAVLIAVLSGAETFPPLSARTFLLEWSVASVWSRASTTCFGFSSPAFVGYRPRQYPSWHRGFPKLCRMSRDSRVETPQQQQAPASSVPGPQPARRLSDDSAANAPRNPPRGQHGLAAGRRSRR
jgi:hypothetical protein